MKQWIGGLDASNTQEQARLEECFVTTKRIAEALESECVFVCGRKGAGKSAVAYKLRSDVKRYPACTEVKPVDYYPLHTELIDSIQNTAFMVGTSPQSVAAYFNAIWTYILHLAAFRNCLLLADSGKIERKAVSDIFSYLSQRGCDETPIGVYVFQRAQTMLSRVSGEASPTAGFGAALNSFLMDESFRRAKKQAAACHRSLKSIVIIDTMERYDLDRMKAASFRGMCGAIKNFVDENGLFGVDVKCFLPAELIDHVFLDNKTKYIAMSTVLEWEYSELIQLLARRYAAALASGSLSEMPGAIEMSRKILDAVNAVILAGKSRNEAWRRNVWPLFAPVAVRNRLTWVEDGAAYMFRHTQKRPREVVCCMNFAVDIALAYPEFPLIGERRMVSAIHSPENLHMLLGDSLSAFRDDNTDTQGRAPEPLVNVFKGVFGGTSTVLSGKSLREYSGRSHSILVRGTIAMDGEFEAVLLRSGLIGVVSDVRRWTDSEGGRCKYYLTQFEYCTPSSLVINEASQCAIHPILADVLHLKDASHDPGVVYHIPSDEEW